MSLLAQVFLWQLTAALVSANVFLQEPQASLAPVHTQAQLSCSVSVGFRISWNILLPGKEVSVNTDDPNIRVALRDSHGIVVTESGSERDSVLVVNGTGANNGTAVTCIAANISSITSRHRSSEVVVIFYGPPPAPSNLSTSANEPGSLTISWSLAFIEGVEIQYKVTATSLNDSNSFVATVMEDKSYVFSVEDDMSCDLYSFQVTAMNAAGASDPSEIITRSLPSLPDTSAVEESLEYHLVKVKEDEVRANISFNAASSCLQYPVLNHTVVIANPMLGMERISVKEDVSFESSVPLRGDSQYYLYVEVTNKVGTVKTGSRVIVTSDVQDVELLLLSNNTFSITCTYLSGSTARGCVYTLISEVEGVQNFTGTVPRDNATQGLLQTSPDNIGCYSEILAYDWERDNSTGRVPITRQIIANESCNSPIGQGRPFVIIIIVLIVAALASLFIIVDLAIVVVLRKKGICAKRRGKLRTDQRSNGVCRNGSAVVQNGVGAASVSGHDEAFVDYIGKHAAGPPVERGREVMVPATSQEHLYSTLTQSLTDRNAYSSQISVERGDSNKGPPVYHVLEHPDLASRSRSSTGTSRSQVDNDPVYSALEGECPLGQVFHPTHINPPSPPPPRLQDPQCLGPSSSPPPYPTLSLPPYPPRFQSPQCCAPSPPPPHPPRLQTTGQCVYAEIEA